MGIEKLGSMQSVKYTDLQETTCGQQEKKISTFGDKIVEEKTTEFTKNPFDQYTEEDYDRFNTILSGRNGAEAQKLAKVITTDINSAYNRFKSEYPNSNLKLPAPPNPADFDKGRKGYNAYREALLLWKSECQEAINNEITKLNKTQPKEQEKEPVKNETPPKTKEPSKSKTAPKKNEDEFDFGKIMEEIRKKVDKNKNNLIIDPKELAKLWLEIGQEKTPPQNLEDIPFK